MNIFLVLMIGLFIMCGVIYITLRLTLNRPIIISKEVWEESEKRPMVNGVDYFRK